MNWLIASSVILCAVACYLVSCGIFYKPRAIYNIACGTILFVYFILMAIFYRDFPKAIDVYQGKTDIEYVYKNGRVTDSVVVFKNIVYCR